MGLSAAEVRCLLEELGVNGAGDSTRSYYVVPTVHTCGRGIAWLVRVDLESGVAESLGAVCEHCTRPPGRVEIPLQLLKELAANPKEAWRQRLIQGIDEEAMRRLAGEAATRIALEQRLEELFG